MKDLMPPLDLAERDRHPGTAEGPGEQRQDTFLSPASFWPMNYVNMSAWVEHVPFAFWLVGELKPRVIVELGSHYGVSYFSMCQAVQAKGLDARCFAVDTWMGDEHSGQYGLFSDEVFDTVDAYNQATYSTFSSLLRCTFEDAIPYFADGSIDLLHVDGRHLYEDVRKDYEDWIPKLSDKAIVLFHDTNVRERQFGVFKYWSELTGRHPSFEFVHGHGLGVLGYGDALPPLVRGLLDASNDPATAAAVRAAYSRLGVAARSHFEAQTARTERTGARAQTANLQAELSQAHERASGLEDELNRQKREVERLASQMVGRTRRLGAALRRSAETDDRIAEFEALARDQATAAMTQSEAAIPSEQAGPHRETVSPPGNGVAVEDPRVAILNHRVEALGSTLTRTTQELAQAQQTMSAFLDSGSWRLTRPVRGLKTGLRRLRGASPPPSVRPEAEPEPLDVAPSPPIPQAPPKVYDPKVRLKFDAVYYMAANPDVIVSGLDPFEHFMEFGWREGRDPSSDFSTSYYLDNNPDVVAIDINPLAHWILHGLAEGRRAVPPVELPPMGTEELTPDELDRVRARFDAVYYASAHPDAVSADVDLFDHYMRVGWRNLYDPAAEFSTSYYLDKYRDIAESGTNPFAHWVLHGLAERRGALPYRLKLFAQDYAPTICAIVPNYNHGAFLARRIESILRQTYANIDVLILDDCSTDDSRDIIDLYCDLYPARVRAIYGTANSGGVFKQWQKGIENSSGDLVWICESDDYCAPDFVETLYRYFCDSSVMIAFGRIQEVDAEGRFVEGLDGYRERAEPGIWDEPLVRPAREWFAKGFGVNNVIANVGGCLWRRSTIPDAIWSEAQTYSVVGDWFLYTVIAGGGQIAWDPRALSFFRRHGSNTSLASVTGPVFYRELGALMLHLRKQWNVPETTVARFYDKVAEQYAWFQLEKKHGPLNKLISRTKLLDQERTRPHILMAFYGFIPGGGELFPINLANALHGQGWRVSMLGFDMLSINLDMKRRLNAAIAVYDSVWVDEYGVDRFIKEAGVSLVHSHTVGAELNFFSHWRMTARIPYLVTLHGSYEACDLPIAEIHAFASKVTHFVVTANKNMEPLRACNFPDTKFTKLPNAMPVETEPFPRTRAEMGIAAEAVVFTLVARGIPSKGWKAAIAAFGKLREENPERPMHLLLCGDGEETDRQEALHGGNPDITFLGYQSRIHGLYRLSDVAIVPSRFSGESFPLCIIQAMQTGCPVIATDVGEIVSMITPKGRNPGGLVIAPEADDDTFASVLAEAMTRFLSPDERRSHAQGAAALGADYSIDKLVRVYGEVYASLLAEGAAVHEAELTGPASRSEEALPPRPADGEPPPPTSPA